jgi:outer membrane biosynthesis protein TonB
MKSRSRLFLFVLLAIGRVASAKDAVTPVSQSEEQMDWNSLPPAPKRKHIQTPAPPSETLTKRMSGPVKIMFRVGADGHIEDLRVVEATSPSFVKTVLAALPNWTFPTQAAGGPYRLEFTFTSTGTSGSVTWK